MMKKHRLKIYAAIFLAGLVSISILRSEVWVPIIHTDPDLAWNDTDGWYMKDNPELYQRAIAASDIATTGLAATSGLPVNR